jgi:hypothetical protein
VERGQRGRRARLVLHLNVAGGHADLGHRLVHRAPAEHVHAGPGQVVTAGQAGPEQRGVQRAAAQRDVGGRAGQHARLAGVAVGDLAGEQAHVDGRAEPGDPVGGFLLVPVGGGDEPPGRDGLLGGSGRAR